MLDRVCLFLEENPGTKARTIAARLGVDRSELSRLLHENGDRFEQDSQYQWSLVSQTCRIEFDGSGWLTAYDFERALRSVSPLTSPHTAVVLVLSNQCKPMLEFLGRLLALCNQLVSAGKSVTLDFEGSKSTLSYLDRVGFFGVLRRQIGVLPGRPAGDLARAFMGNNDGVIEFRLVDPAAPDREIPALLRHSFVKCAGDSYFHPAFTVLAELFDNILEHSSTGSPGFACLQFYPKGRKIQAVISDNGRGIVGTLTPVIPQKYPALADMLLKAKHPGIALLTEMFKKGNISQVNADGRGIGLKRSGDIAERFRARISVRQSDFELGVHHNHDGTRFTGRTGLAHLEGTHICFEFKLDAPPKAA